MTREGSRGGARAGPAQARSELADSGPPVRRLSPAEAGLLELARALAAIPTASGEGDGLARALDLLDRAFGPSSLLPRQLAQAWLQTLGDKTGALALGWAREQVRRALAEVVDAVSPEAGREPAVPADTAAWLLLAAAEGESHEVGGTVSDRLGAVCALLGLS